MFKKILLLIIGFFVIFAIVFTLNNESSKSSLVIYFNGAVVTEKFSDFHILPKNVIEESVTTFGKDFYLIYPKSDVDSLIGKNLEVIYDEGKEINGKLIDVKNNMFYIFSNNRTFVVKPEAFSVAGIFYSDRQSYPTIHSKEQTLISYAIPSLKWRGQTIVDVKNKNADISVGALIKNLDEEKAYNSTETKLISGDVNFYRIYRHYKAQYDEMTGVEMVKISTSEKEGFLEYSLGHIYIPPKGRVFTHLVSFSSPISKYNKLEIYFSNTFKDRTPSLIFEFEVKDNVPAGIVKVYNEGEFLGLDYIRDIPKGGNVTISIGHNRFIRVNAQEVSYIDLGNFYDREMKWYIKNFGNRNEIITLHIHMPYENWTIINNTGNYVVLDKNNIKFVVSLNSGESVNLSLKIRVKKEYRGETR